MSGQLSAERREPVLKGRERGERNALIQGGLTKTGAVLSRAEDTTRPSQPQACLYTLLGHFWVIPLSLSSQPPPTQPRASFT